MTETTQPQMGFTFEQVWAALMELRNDQKETDRQLKEQAKETDWLIRELREDGKETDKQLKETDRLLKEQAKETDRQLKEQAKETDRTITKMNQQLNQAIGKLGNRFGELIEHLVSPNLLEKFKALDYAFSRTNTRVKYKDQNTNETIAEVDVLLENGDFVLAVEIKSSPSIEDVKDHAARMETLRVYADSHNDKRKYIGAVAGGIIDDSVKNYALKSGFYVIEQSGDTVSVATVHDSWKPKTW